MLDISGKQLKRTIKTFKPHLKTKLVGTHQFVYLQTKKNEDVLKGNNQQADACKQLNGDLPRTERKML